MLAILIPFFIAQNQYSYNALQDRSANETATQVLSLINRDLYQSGTGCRSYMPLSIFVVNAGTGGFDSLYINYSGHLNFRADLDSFPTGTASELTERALLRANNIYMEGATVDQVTVPTAQPQLPASFSPTYQGWMR